MSMSMNRRQQQRIRIRLVLLLLVNMLGFQQTEAFSVVPYRISMSSPSNILALLVLLAHGVPSLKNKSMPIVKSLKNSEKKFKKRKRKLQLQKIEEIEYSCIPPLEWYSWPVLCLVRFMEK